MKTKVIKDFRGQEYVRTVEHFKNLTVRRNYPIEQLIIWLCYKDIVKYNLVNHAHSAVSQITTFLLATLKVPLLSWIEQQISNLWVSGSNPDGITLFICFRFLGEVLPVFVVKRVQVFNKTSIGFIHIGAADLRRWN